MRGRGLDPPPIHINLNNVFLSRFQNRATIEQSSDWGCGVGRKFKDDGGLGGNGGLGRSLRKGQTPRLSWHIDRFNYRLLRLRYSR